MTIKIYKVLAVKEVTVFEGIKLISTIIMYLLTCYYKASHKYSLALSYILKASE